MNKKILSLAICFLLLFFRSLSQNIGIGTISPAEKLHVVGNMKADTIKPNALKLTPNAGAGKILTSDAAGNASWQAGSTLSGAGNIGYGVWGDCATNGNISEYQPVADITGAQNDEFGHSVSISGNFAIVGAPFDDIGANSNQGSASIYQYDGSNWVLMQKITDADGAAEDQFGTSVSISGNYAMVGAPFDNLGAIADFGSASIYQWNGSSWVLMQKIVDAGGAANDRFGYSVSISGVNAIAGAYLDDIGANVDQGSVSFYRWNNVDQWVLMQKSADPGGAAGDNFGYSVSVFGDYAIIGAYRDDIGANSDQGSATIYIWNGSNGWPLMQKITDATGLAGDFFGVSVSISGELVIVGASQDDVGSNTSQGSASIFQLIAGNWALMSKIINTSGAIDDFLGTSVSISGNYAIVGSQGDDIGSSSFQGSAIVYYRVGNGWYRLQYVTDPAGEPNSFFGFSTSIDGVTKRFLIGAYGVSGSSGKAVFGKLN